METALNHSTLAVPILAASLELASKEWKIGLSDGQHGNPRVVRAVQESLAARLTEAEGLVEDARRKWLLPADARVVFVYEAGQDGFWIKRQLEAHGYECLIVDPASIPVERHARRAKTDRLDAVRLVQCLRAYLSGETERMHVNHVPSPEAEDQRHLMRERGLLQKEAIQHRDRIGKLLRLHGCHERLDVSFPARLRANQVRGADGQEIAANLRERILREWDRLLLAEGQLADLEKHAMAQLPPQAQERIAHLKRLAGIGQTGASRLVLELFWRRFENRRQVGACVGLTPQPYDSGNSRVDQGISRAGNGRVRALLVEMAWFWLRYQPNSELSRWFAERTQGTGPNKRARRIAIVAVARRLVITLWRYLEHGVVPNGATLKPA